MLVPACFAALLAQAPAAPSETDSEEPHAHEHNSPQMPESRSKRSAMHGYLTPIGLVVFGVGYLPPLAVGLVAVARQQNDDENFETDAEPRPVGLVVPLAGPAIAWGMLPRDYRTPKVTALVIADTSVQLAGVVLASVGLAVNRRRNRQTAQRGPRVLPYLAGRGRGSLSFGVTGRF